MKLKLNSIQHVGIPVSNLERSKEFYQHLGFENVMQTTFPHNETNGHVAMMQYNNIVMELYQMPEPELTAIKNRRDGHIDHIAFDVDNIYETLETIKNLGLNPIEKEPVFLNFWSKGCKYFYILGPDNERLEFCEIIK